MYEKWADDIENPISGQHQALKRSTEILFIDQEQVDIETITNGYNMDASQSGLGHWAPSHYCTRYK